MALRIFGVALAATALGLAAATHAAAADLDHGAPMMHDGAAPIGVATDGYTPSGPNQPAAINVILNQAKVLKLSRPAATIIIGNPAIADATVQDASTIVLTGQGFGRTNLVILDQNGEPVFDETISVTRDQLATLRVYRRANIETLSCDPYCEAAYLTEAEIESTRERARVNALFDDND